MKKTISTIAILFAAAFILPSCGEDEAFSDLVLESPDQLTLTDDEDEGYIKPTKKKR